MVKKRRPEAATSGLPYPFYKVNPVSLKSHASVMEEENQIQRK
ncbi:conserved hypothetical protein [delta proteobacterium NaphS2]|nr:conserved hypothetical protein [delta proteobacterium NaphS2]